MQNKNIIMRFCFVVLAIIVVNIIFPKISLASSPEFNWAKQLVSKNGSESYNTANSVVTDANSDNSYITGQFFGTVDFDPGAGTVELTSAGDYDIFILKLNSSGEYVWAKKIGGTGSEHGISLVLDSDSNVYVTGYFSGTVDFDPGAGTVELTSAGDSDIFILKLNSSGEYVWAKSVGGAGYDSGNSITLDRNANVYITGCFSNTTDFDPGAGTVELTSAGDYDIFILKLNSSGEYVWAKSVGGNSSDSGYSIALDTNANVHVTGFFWNTVDFNPGGGTAELTAAGGEDIFILKLNSSGEYVWAKSIGGNDSDYSYSITLDRNANVYITGQFFDTVDFDPGAGTAELTSAGEDDAFIMKLNSSGEYVWTKSVGNTGNDGGFSLDLDSNDNVYVAGVFEDTVDFDPSDGVNEINSTSSGGDTFLLKLDELGSFEWVGSIYSSDNGSYPYSLNIDSLDNVFLVGEFYGNADFNPGPSSYELNASFGNDAYILKLSPPDVTDPIITETTSIPTPATDTTPEYTFTSSEAGTITYGGVCSSNTTEAVEGLNTITLNELAAGTYSDCTITVTDAANNASDPLSITSFTIETQTQEPEPGSTSRHSSGSYLPGYGPRALNPLPNNPILPDVTSFTFTKTLKQNTTDNEVKNLQIFLNTHGYVLSNTGPGSSGKETTKFGPLTKKALIRFQKDHNLTPDGIFGQKTRAVVNALLKTS